MACRRHIYTYMTGMLRYRIYFYPHSRNKNGNSYPVAERNRWTIVLRFQDRTNKYKKGFQFAFELQI